MRKRSRLNASVLIDLAKMRHRLLDDAPPNPPAARQAPIGVNLSILLANRVAQVHARAIRITSVAKENTQGHHHTLKSPSCITTL
jgi:hypothetical protein